MDRIKTIVCISVIPEVKMYLKIIVIVNSFRGSVEFLYKLPDKI